MHNPKQKIPHFFCILHKQKGIDETISIFSSSLVKGNTAIYILVLLLKHYIYSLLLNLSRYIHNFNIKPFPLCLLVSLMKSMPEQRDFTYLQSLFLLYAKSIILQLVYRHLELIQQFFESNGQSGSGRKILWHKLLQSRFFHLPIISVLF